MSMKAKLNLTNSLALSKITYAACIWGNTTPNFLKKVQVVLNSAARMCTGMSKLTKQRDLMEKCGWMDVEETVTYYSLQQMWKTLRWRLPGYMTDKIALEDDDILATCRPRLQITAGSYRHKTVERWNGMPNHLRTEMSIAKFKKGLKEWIKSSRRNEDAPEEDETEDRPPDGMRN